LAVGVVYYRKLLEGAQTALRTGAVSPGLVHAIGEAIGNTAAHEIGHLLAVPSPPMDIATPDVLNGGCSDLSHYTGIIGVVAGRPLYLWWDAATAKILDKKLNPGH
jgi:hypothetical protein